MVTKLVVARRNISPAGASQTKKRKVNDEKIRASMKRIRAEMVGISEGQKRIRKGHKEVRKKFEEIGKEAAKLKQETDMISKQSAANQLRLDLMFQIVKARAEKDSAKDAVLTQTLREIMANQNLSAIKQREEARTTFVNRKC